MSQLSDKYPSSIAEGVGLEDLSYLVPDDTLFSSSFPSSQPSFNTTLDNSSVPRPLAPPAPENLRRIKPDRINEYLSYEANMSKEFVEWWLQTDYGRKRRINWDGRHHAACWEGFDQVANTKDGKPGVMCKRCRTVLEHPASAHSGTSSMNKHLKGPQCQRGTGKPSIQKLLVQAGQRAPAQVFTQSTWEQKLLNLVTVSHLPFLFLEHQEFYDLISYARLAPTTPTIPSRKVIRTRLREFVTENQTTALRSLPPDAKLSLALDCWTSPFQQAFIAITAYFLDRNWDYREVLLAFEPLSGTHSGANLSEVVVRTLQQHQILNRVLAITTDNASNNTTLIAVVNDTIQALKLNTKSAIIQVPCIAHVIQLSLNDLLGKMKASPKNNTAELEWKEDRVRALRARQQKREIADTLNKIRSLAIYINASPQRRDAFYNLQPDEPKLVPIQDVRTRWNSTYLMLRRAKRLQATFDIFCSQYDQPHFALNTEEWRQIDYLLFILQPFFKYTTVVCTTKDISIHLVFSFYNRLFDHLENSIRQLRQKKVPWKQLMLSSLEAAQEKLSKYYAMTDRMEGDLYAIGTILAPANKLQFFSTKEWESDDPEKDYKRIYHSSLKSLFTSYEEKCPKERLRSDAILSMTTMTDADLLFENSHASLPPQQNELMRYLESPTVRGSPRVFWKDHEHEFPILASLARDVMSIPATGAGVERLFNSARDICHYRRGSLKPETIRDIMLWMCTTRFDLQEQKRLMLQEYLSHQEIAAMTEASEIRDESFDPISDTEEETEDIVYEAEGIQPPNAQSLPQSCTTTLNLEDREAMDHDENDDDDDDNINPPLPDIQQRVSSRKRKRSKLLEGYVLGSQ